LTKRKNILRYV